MIMKLLLNIIAQFESISQHNASIKAQHNCKFSEHNIPKPMAAC